LSRKFAVRSICKSVSAEHTGLSGGGEPDGLRGKYVGEIGA